MTLENVNNVREVRAYLKSCDAGDTSAMLFIATILIFLASAALCACVMSASRALGVGFGSAVSFLCWALIIIYSRRAWLMARAAFEVAADGVDANPETFQEGHSAQPEPEPFAAPPPDPMARISADAELRQLLNDMPTEKLQAIIDARAMRTQ